MVADSQSQTQTPAEQTRSFGERTRARLDQLAVEVTSIRARIEAQEQQCIDRATSVAALLTHRRARHARKHLGSQNTTDTPNA